MNRLMKLLPLFAVVCALSCATAPKECGCEAKCDAGLTEIEAFMLQANDPSGYVPLFKDDLSNVDMAPGSWAIEDGVLGVKTKGSIWTKERYGDFILDIEVKLSPKTNSGIFIRTDNIKSSVQTGIEIQIYDGEPKRPHNAHGAIYDLVPPSKDASKPVGEWDRFFIIAKDNKLHVVLNDEHICEMDMNQWTEKNKNPDGTKNKFKTPYKDMKREGHMGLQYHGHPIWFRNARVKEL